MRILLLDIETAPNLAYVWGTWKQNISMDKIVDKSYVLCWTAKWFGSKETMFSSVNDESPKRMLAKIHRLLDESEAVVHYNGKAFDIPTLNKEFVTHGMTPPSPYKQIDLLEVVRDRFNFPINKLDYVVQALGLGAKVRHPGFQMWVDCMAGDQKAWAKMEEYNRGDVAVLEKLYLRIRPWVRNHPNVAAMDGRPDACPTCGEEGTMQRRGLTPPKVGSDTRYYRYVCAGHEGCGAWARGKKVVARSATTTVGV